MTGLTRTKLVPPGSRVALLPRRRLLEPLRRDGLGHQVVVVCAGAGYGKTELAAALHRELDTDAKLSEPTPCWYSLDQSDRDPAVFLAHLAATLGASCPGLMTAIEDVLRAEGGDACLRVGLPVVINYLDDRRPLETLLILDDVHEVEEGPLVWQGLEQLLLHQPANLRLVLTTRRQPALEPLVRQRAAGQVLELDEAQLGLTADEIGELFRDVYELPLSEEAVEHLHARTDGWLAGLQLYQQYLRRPDGGAIENVVLDAAAPADLFDYLGGEVLAGEREEMQTLLLSSSVLDRLTGSICDVLVGTQGSGVLLEEAHHRRLFLYPLDGSGEWYRFHPLFQEFLSRRLRALTGDAGVQEMHGRAARHLRQQQRLEEAIGHHLAAGQHGLAAELLDEVGPELMRAGRFSRTERWLDEVAEEVKDEYPGLWLVQGRLSYLRGEASIPYFSRARTQFEAVGDALGVSAARRGEAGAHFRLGRYDDATELAERALEGLDDEHTAERAEVLTLLGICASESADLDAAERHLDAALVLHRETGDSSEQARVLHNLATVYIARGQFRRALAADGRALELIGSLTAPLRGAIYITVGQAHWYLGEYDQAREALGLLDDLCAELGLQLHRCYALCLEADILLETANSGAATRLYEQAEVIGHQLGEPSMLILPWLGLARTHRAENRLSQARQAAERALGAARGIGYEWFIGKALNELGAVHLATGDQEMAAQSLDEAQARMAALGSRYEHAVCCLRKAWLGRDDSAGGQLLEEALQIAEAEGYDHLLLVREAEVAHPLLEAARDADVRVPYVSRLLAERDARDARAMTVTVLGGFAVHTAGEEIAIPAGQPAQLVKLLAVNHGRLRAAGAIDALWPDVDEETGRTRLRQALHRLRRAVPIVDRRDADQLALHDGVEVDAIEFERLARDALQGSTGGESDAALALYRGDLLPDDLFEEWAAGPRERARTLYLGLLDRRAEQSRAAGDLDEALRSFLEAIDADPYDERRYLEVVTILLTQGRSGQARRLARRAICMIEELGVPVPARLQEVAGPGTSHKEL